jgi:rod shape-determining protein MreD
LRFVFYGGVLLLLIPVQSILLEWVSIYGIKPDLSLWFVYLIGFLHGEWKGGLMGVLCGIIFDSFSPGKFGMNIFIKGLLGFTAGFLGRALLETKALFHFGMLFFFSIIQGILIYWFLLIGGESVIFREVFFQIILPQALYDCVLGGLMINLIFAIPQIQAYSLREKGI